MATLKLILDTRNKTAKKFPLVIKVSHKQLPKNIPTGYKLSLDEWNEGELKIQKPFQNSARANARVQAKLSIANTVLSEEQENLKKIDVYTLVSKIEKAIQEKLSTEETGESDNLNNQGNILNQEIKTSLFKYGEKQIEILKKAKQFKYAINFENALSSFKKFVNNNDLLISEITETFLREYEADCKSKNISINAYGAYLRAIRRIFNLAIKDPGTEVNQLMYPFGLGGYSIKVERTRKRAVEESVIDLVRKLKLEIGTSIWDHKSYFLLMFNWRGMNFIDLAFLKVENIYNGRLIYERRKTRDKFDIKLTPEAKNILSYYLKGKKRNDLIFPIINDIINCGDDEYIRKTCDGRLKIHNKYLNKIGELLELGIHLSSYVVRHSFASIARKKGVSKSTIGDMLGHESYVTTETYFADLEPEILDEAADIAFKKQKK